MEHNKNATHFEQNFNNFKFSTIKPFVGDESQKSKIVKSIPNNNKEIIPLTCEQNNIFFESHSNSNEFSEARMDLKNLFSKCKFCRKKFDKVSDLIIHRKSHTDERFFLHLPFKCTFCPLAFNNIQQLKKHSKTHPSKKPYKCDICSKYFLLPDSLQQHALVIHGKLKNN